MTNVLLGNALPHVQHQVTTWAIVDVLKLDTLEQTSIKLSKTFPFKEMNLTRPSVKCEQFSLAFDMLSKSDAEKVLTLCGKHLMAPAICWIYQFKNIHPKCYLLVSYNIT